MMLTSRGSRRSAAVSAGFGLLLGGVFAIFMYREYAGWRVDRIRAVLNKVPARRLALCRCQPDTSFYLRRADGLRLAASLYGTESADPQPGILLLHGMTPFGRQLPIYRTLATVLARQGFVVMTVDFAGFGQSDDPFVHGSLTALEREQDVRTALRFLEQYPGTAPTPITLVGHSMGAVEAMAVGQVDSAVDRIVAIGPPRRTAEVMATVEGREEYWDRRRRQYDSVYHRPLPAWYTRDIYLAQKARHDSLPLWSPGHRPLLLIDGGREPDRNLVYLRAYFERMAEPKAYVTVPDADHYLNTGTVLGWTYYDGQAVGLAASIIVRWRRWNPSRSAGVIANTSANSTAPVSPGVGISQERGWYPDSVQDDGSAPLAAHPTN